MKQAIVYYYWLDDNSSYRIGQNTKHISISQHLHTNLNSVFSSVIYITSEFHNEYYCIVSTYYIVFRFGIYLNKLLSVDD